MPDPISHAEIVAWCRNDIAWKRGHGWPDDEIEMQSAVLAHLERTQPTDTQADLAEGARVTAAAAAEEQPSPAAGWLRRIEAARAEARRAALEEAALLVDHHPFSDDAEADCVDAQGCCEMMAAQIRSLASPPAPQEETR